MSAASEDVLITHQADGLDTPPADSTTCTHEADTFHEMTESLWQAVPGGITRAT